MEYTLENIRTDLEQIKLLLLKMEQIMEPPALETIHDSEEAHNLFSRLTKVVDEGHSLELIIRKVYL
jgi:hypothetical protein